MEDIFTSISLVFSVSKILGQANIKVKGAVGKREIFPSVKWKIYSTILLLFIIFGTYLTQRPSDVRKDSKHLIVLRFYVFINILLNVITLAMHILFESKVRKALQRLISLDIELRHMGIFIDYKKEQQKIYRMFILQFAFLILYYCHYCEKHLKEKGLSVSINHISALFRKLLRLTLLIQIQAWMQIFITRFDILRNNLLESVTNLRENNRSTLISQTAKLHQELYWIITEVNDFYSISMLVSVLVNFLSCVMHFYGIWGKSMPLLNYFIDSYSVITHGIFFIITVIYYSKTTDAVSNALFYIFLLNNRI